VVPTSTRPAISAPGARLESAPPPSPAPGRLRSTGRACRLGNSLAQASRLARPALPVAKHPSVEISPAENVRRQVVTGRGLASEFVSSTSRDRVDYRFRGPVHLLLAYEQGVRRDGETFVDGLPRSCLRDLARKLVFVPAGHEYREWHEPRAPTRLMYVYVHPAALESQAQSGASHKEFAPRLFFEDTALWVTVLKLRQLIEQPIPGSQLYFDALSAVLMHELIGLNCGTGRLETRLRGGLAAWQQRAVAAYIEENLCGHISLATLASLARLSPYHFCRAFKRSFGMPPHCYHTVRRIERAKVLLEQRQHSVTEIGLALGFHETSSFSATFRKVTGVTPTAYFRSVT